MISVVMPYYERPKALEAFLIRALELYGSLLGHVEFIVVDDGSVHEPARNVITYRQDFMRDIHVHCIELPKKRMSKNPCVPINVGVEKAEGDVIVLTNPEVIHREALLFNMEMDVLLNSRNYVCAAVLDSGGKWYQHSEHANHHLHFLTAMSREVWDCIGGFDEEYRDGYCFDDTDFAKKLEVYGVNWVERDDLIADHRSDLQNKMSPATKVGWGVNRALYERKWGGLPSIY